MFEQRNALDGEDGFGWMQRPPGLEGCEVSEGWRRNLVMKSLIDVRNIIIGITRRDT